MEVLQKKFQDFKTWANRPRTKKRKYALLVLIVIAWVLFRFAMIAAENRLVVFNPARGAADTGIVVNAIDVKRTDGIVREPLTVRGNRALVSGARASLFRAGQKIGNGEIVSVSSNIDLNTGMYGVRTRGVADGLNFAETKISGYFVPAYAVTNGTVFVLSDGHAQIRNVRVARIDADNAVITSGLNDGDIVILSNVSDGEKVQIKK